jgi:hypothetical protein
MKKKNIIEQRKFTIPSVISVYMNQVYMIFVLLDNEELALRAVLLPKAYKSLDPTDEARTWICKKKRHGASVITLGPRLYIQTEKTWYLVHLQRRPLFRIDSSW